MSNSNKTVIILCGIPGSGKTHYANHVRSFHPDTTRIVSADHFHIQPDGSYQFDFRNLREAHNQCLRNYMAALLEPEVTHIIVDNNNTSNWERASYVAQAQLMGVPVEHHMIHCEPEVAVVRQTHNVPARVVWQRHFAMEDPIPFWGKVFDVTADPADVYARVLR